MIRIRPSRALLLAVPLAFLPALTACDSPTIPKFPEPIEEPEDSTPEEGMTGRWSLSPKSIGGVVMETGVMPFTFSAMETT